MINWHPLANLEQWDPEVEDVQQESKSDFEQTLYIKENNNETKHINQ